MKRLFSTSTSSVRYSEFITPVARRRVPSAIRAIAPLTRIPGMISMAAGLPNSCCFPFESLNVTLKSGESFLLEGKQINEALQYSVTEGVPDLMQWLEILQKRYHNPSVEYKMIVTTGSQHAFSMAADMLINEGDHVLVEDPTYSGALAYLRPLGAKLIPCKIDGDGLVLEHLESILKSGQLNPKPKVLYTIPTGQNPSGATLSLERRRRLLKLASEYNFLIMEDDPYYFLQFNNFIPSLFSLDTEGRVLRFDSFSKVLSSGMRLGWMSGPAPLIERVNLHMQASTLHTSGVSQALVSSLLNHWQLAGWEKHVDVTRNLYSTRRIVFEDLANRFLKGKAEWTSPNAGMFVWFRLNGVADTAQLIEQKAREKKVLLVPGQAFSATDSPSSYVRASFSTATTADMEIGLERFSQLLS